MTGGKGHVQRTRICTSEVTTVWRYRNSIIIKPVYRLNIGIIRERYQIAESLRHILYYVIYIRTRAVEDYRSPPRQLIVQNNVIIKQTPDKTHPVAEYSRPLIGKYSVKKLLDPDPDDFQIQR